MALTAVLLLFHRIQLKLRSQNDRQPIAQQMTSREDIKRESDQRAAPLLAKL